MLPKSFLASSDGFSEGFSIKCPGKEYDSKNIKITDFKKIIVFILIHVYQQS